jgi:hypothetical protein
MSYDGHVDFGLLGDYDAMADLDLLAGDVRDAIAELAVAAGLPATTDGHSRGFTSGARGRARAR